MNAKSKEADIVERLARSLKPFWSYTQNDVIGDAMAEITNIRAECDGLRSANAALKQMVSDKDGLLTALRAERDAAARDMRERCAKVLDEAAQDWNRIRDPGMASNARCYAKNIRALPDTPGDQQP